MIQITCPHCHGLMQHDGRLGGRPVQCPFCHQVFTATVAPPPLPPDGDDAATLSDDAIYRARSRGDAGFFLLMFSIMIFAILGIVPLWWWMSQEEISPYDIEATDTFTVSEIPEKYRQNQFTDRKNPYASRVKFTHATVDRIGRSRSNIPFLVVKAGEESEEFTVRCTFDDVERTDFFKAKVGDIVSLIGTFKRYDDAVYTFSHCDLTSIQRRQFIRGGRN